MKVQYAELGPRDVCGRLSEYRVFDVREPYEFCGPLGRIEGATLVPKSGLEQAVKDLAFDSPMLFVCRSGRRSGKACETLLIQGYGGVTNLIGGMIEWNNVGLPVVKEGPGSLGDLVTEILDWSVQVGAWKTYPEAKTETRAEAKAKTMAEKPSDAEVAHLIDDLEQAFSEWSPVERPPDLALSLASFRRSLSRITPFPQRTHLTGF